MVYPIPFAGHVVVDDFTRKDVYMWASEAGFSTLDIQNNIFRLEKFARSVEWFVMDRENVSE